MKRDPLLMWGLGVMATVIIALILAFNAMNTARLDRLETQIDLIVQQYGKITSMEELLREMRADQKELRRQVNELYRGLR